MFEPLDYAQRFGLDLTPDLTFPVISAWTDREYAFTAYNFDYIDRSFHIDIIFALLFTFFLAFCEDEMSAEFVTKLDGALAPTQHFINLVSRNRSINAILEQAPQNCHPNALKFQLLLEQSAHRARDYLIAFKKMKWADSVRSERNAGGGSGKF